LRQYGFVYVGVAPQLRRREVKSWLRIPRARLRTFNCALETATDSDVKLWSLLLSDRDEDDSEGILDGTQSLEELDAFADAIREATLHLGEVWILRRVAATGAGELHWSRRVIWDQVDIGILSPLEPGLLLVCGG
jgi:hypothetical protein